MKRKPNLLILAFAGILVVGGGMGLWAWQHKYEWIVSADRRHRRLDAVKPYDDVRWCDLRRIDFRDQMDWLASLNFNRGTRWPRRANLPPGFDPENLLTSAMNPGLGVRELHRQGITGKGVNVAIIDQPLPGKHPEYAGKILAYYAVGGDRGSSMHGPAVTSLLVGTRCGTAPDARVFYATARLVDYGEALNWILEQNAALPATAKIRVVSVSAGPSGPDSYVTSKIHQDRWDAAFQRAEAAGVLVLDCTKQRGFIGSCYYDATEPEDVARCRSGYPGSKPWPVKEHLLAPASPRTTAEEYDRGARGYQYYGRGGQSWAIPYCAGVLALGWQVRPELTPQQMRELLFASAFVTTEGAKIIDPKAFIKRVRGFAHDASNGPLTADH
jgi:subtilisin family serine protease